MLNNYARSPLPRQLTVVAHLVAAVSQLAVLAAEAGRAPALGQAGGRVAAARAVAETLVVLALSAQVAWRRGRGQTVSGGRGGWWIGRHEVTPGSKMSVIDSRNTGYKYT